MVVVDNLHTIQVEKNFGIQKSEQPDVVIEVEVEIEFELVVHEKKKAQ